MRGSIVCKLSATLAAISLFCSAAGAATVTVHTQTPKVNVRVTPPKVQTPTPRVSHQDLTVTKYTDKSSPKLYEALHNGTHIPKVTVYSKTGKQSGQPHEQMQLNFSKTQMKY